MAETVNLYDAKTQLSRLVDRVAAGEEIVIAKNGKPMAKLVPLPAAALKPRRLGRNLAKLKNLDPDLFAPDPEIQRLFEESELFPRDDQP
jgi:prevent-host-death family protein